MQPFGETGNRRREGIVLSRRSTTSRRCMCDTDMTSRQWAEFERRSEAFRIIGISFLPGMFLGGYAANTIFQTELAFLLVGILWMLLICIAGTSRAMFPCPRCRKRILWRSAVPAYAWSKKCVHCDWPIGRVCVQQDQQDWEHKDLLCLQCGVRMKSDSLACRQCGWSYESSGKSP